MKARLILGTLFIGVLAASLWLDTCTGNHWASLAILVFLGVAGAVEWNRITSRTTPTYPGLLVVAAFVYPLVEWARIQCGWDGGRSDSIFLFAFFFLLAGRAVLGGDVKDGLDRIARTLFGFLLLFFFYRLASVLMDAGSVREGLAAAYALVLTSKSCDIGAYLVGRTFGRAKLIPRVSPGKTRIGGLGGLAFSVTTGAVAFALMGRSIPAGLIFGLVLGVVTMLSDLLESLAKRCAGVKDSSNLLPEMGGVLDLIDSLVLAAPAGYILYRVL